MFRWTRTELRIFIHNLCHMLSETFNTPNCKIAKCGGWTFRTKIITLEVVVIQTIKHKVRKSRHNCLTALRLNNINNIVIRVRVELNKNFTDYTDFWLFDCFVNFDCVKVCDYFINNLFKFKLFTVIINNIAVQTLLPLFVYRICFALVYLVRTDTKCNGKQ